MSSPARLFWRRAARQLRTIVPGNLRTGRLPDPLMLADVLERGIERTDAVWQARQIGVEGNMHDASGCGTFAIEGIELPAYRVLEISRGHIGALEGLLVINVIAVRQCRDRLVPAERHRVGLIVVGAPICNIFATCLHQEIERVPSLLQSRAQPADGTRTAHSRDGVERVADDRGLLVGWHFVEAARVALVVSHPFPVTLLAFLDDSRMVDTDVAVERDGRAHAVTVENLHQPKHADAVAVVAHGPDRDVRNLARTEAARTRFQREKLDIGNDPQGDARIARPFERRPSDEGRVREGAVGTGFHEASRERAAQAAARWKRSHTVGAFASTLDQPPFFSCWPGSIGRPAKAYSAK